MLHTWRKRMRDLHFKLTKPGVCIKSNQYRHDVIRTHPHTQRHNWCWHEVLLCTTLSLSVIPQWRTCSPSKWIKHTQLEICRQHDCSHCNWPVAMWTDDTSIFWTPTPLADILSPSMCILLSITDPINKYSTYNIYAEWCTTTLRRWTYSSIQPIFTLRVHGMTNACAQRCLEQNPVRYLKSYRKQCRSKLTQLQGQSHRWSCWTTSPPVLVAMRFGTRIPETAPKPWVNRFHIDCNWLTLCRKTSR